MFSFTTFDLKYSLQAASARQSLHDFIKCSESSESAIFQGLQNLGLCTHVLCLNVYRIFLTQPRNIFFHVDGVHRQRSMKTILPEWIHIVISARNPIRCFTVSFTLGYCCILFDMTSILLIVCSWDTI